ncbi:hypothetical protein RHOSPDRAFT_33484 [Rhodotorula sp. JG-1b]|nr:hypothetical protein RHOSPDRAFT_33484 [Rhodotorula sp. JG-1b]
MRLIRTVIVCATALLVSAQSDSTDASDSSDPTAGLLSDFPTQCLSSCSVFNDVVSQCGQLSETDSEQAALDCLCNGSFKSNIEACGGCIAQNTADVSTSASFLVIAQLGATFGQQCGRQINVQGVTPEISSALALGYPGNAGEATMTDVAALAGEATATAAGATSESAASTPTGAAVEGPSSASTSGTTAAPSNTAQSASISKETSGTVSLSPARAVLVTLVVLPFALL